MYFLSNLGPHFQNKGIERPKRTTKAAKLEKFKIFYKSKIEPLKIMNEICFIDFFHILQFCGLWGMFWPLKSLILKMGSQFLQKVH